MENTQRLGTSPRFVEHLNISPPSTVEQDETPPSPLELSPVQSCCDESEWAPTTVSSSPMPLHYADKDAAPLEPSVPPKPPKKKRRSRRTVYICMLLLALLIAIGLAVGLGVCFAKTNKPKPSAQALPQTSALALATPASTTATNPLDCGQAEATHVLSPGSGLRDSHLQLHPDRCHNRTAEAESR
ncbi:hypothetical protein K470DRAFT_256059 [Piedraia hortae CBS 480.64]|uniref:Uncharacterized protein n=1 Tax=Piedraia hortae CBS 480.64 TaxID=1314780 RepID=A0A6A7C4B2_9PEZI|nr:hypothetical protein K470DRAFT_256059 [Piedraia hortae CBS 480.64]